MNNRLTIILATFFLLLSVSESHAQDKTKDGLTESQITELVTSRQFRFKAQNMFPSGGGSRVLTENYTMNVSPEEINADLPYMGRAYTAPVNPSDGGIRFTSKDFTYEKKDRKKGGWELNFSPKDAQDVRTCQLTVYENGNANLTVISNNRQTINYSGIIIPLEKKKQ